MPRDEVYLEIGTMAGRTLEAASVRNEDKTFVACDPCTKYAIVPNGIGPNVRFFQRPFAALDSFERPIGLVFYDGAHDALANGEFIDWVTPRLAGEAVVVFDDWDRTSVRSGVFGATKDDHRWQLLREMPEYTDGVTCAPHHFGYWFGVAVWGFRR